jgi:hypothetical protein
VSRPGGSGSSIQPVTYTRVDYIIVNWLLGKKFDERQPFGQGNSEIERAFHKYRHDFLFNLSLFHGGLLPGGLILAV